MLICLVAGAAGAAGVAAAQTPPVETFGAWEIRHLEDTTRPDGARASLSTDAGFISVECRRTGPATLIANWTSNDPLGSPDDYTPREVTVQWDEAEPETQPWEIFVGSAWQRSHDRAFAFATALQTHARVTFRTVDDQGAAREGVFDLGPASDTAEAMRQIIRDCRVGWR